MFGKIPRYLCARGVEWCNMCNKRQAVRSMGQSLPGSFQGHAIITRKKKNAAELHDYVPNLRYNPVSPELPNSIVKPKATSISGLKRMMTAYDGSVAFFQAAVDR